MKLEKIRKYKWSQWFVKVLDFNNNQDYFVFYKDETGKQRKVLKNDIRVRVEVEN